jgi:uncharacterized membrane protein
MNNSRLNLRYVKSFQVNDPIPLPLVLDNPRKAIAELNQNDLKVLNHLLFKSNRYQDLYMRQSYIAGLLGLCRKTISRIISKLCAMGFIGKVYRANKTCLYRVSSWFSDFNVRNRLKDILWSLTFMSVNLLRPEPVTEKMSHDIIIGDIFKQKQKQNINYDNKESLILNPIRKMGYGVKTRIIERLSKNLELDANAVLRLDNYSVSELEVAERTVKNATAVSNKAGFFFNTLKKLAEKRHKQSLSPETAQTMQSISDNFGFKQQAETNTESKPPIYKPYQSNKDLNISESWNKSPAELADMKKAGLDKIKDLIMQRAMADLFDKCIENAQRFDITRPQSNAKADFLRRKSNQDRYIVEMNGGRTLKDIRQEEGLQAFAELMPKSKMTLGAIGLEPATTKLSEDDAWWAQQQPMDIDNFDVHI